MTLPLPDPKVNDQGWDVERDGVQRNLEALAAALIDTGGRQLKMRIGTQAITWPGANQNSNIATVTHGLGGTPVVVVATLTANSTANFPNVATFTYGATSFQVQLQTTDGTSPANTTTSSVVWAAIG